MHAKLRHGADVLEGGSGSLGYLAHTLFEGKRMQEEGGSEK